MSENTEGGSVRPDAETLWLMPAINVERLREDGPFRVGAVYGVAAGESDEHFSGVIIGVRSTGPKHVEVTVELSDTEHERLLAYKR